MFFRWDVNFRSLNMELDDFNLAVTCKNIHSNSQFKSILGDACLYAGNRYYYEVKFLKGSNFKIGISTRDADLDLAFSDKEHGWAYYSSGYLRHNSGGDGPSYGESFGENNIVGVYVDMIEGKLFFSKNVTVFPVAYESKDFLNMKLYPACSFFQEGESFELMMPTPED